MVGLSDLPIIHARLAVVVGLLSTSLLIPVTGAAAEQGVTTVLEEIIVTAQRREQSAQDVPIAIDAFSGDFLKDRNVEDVFDVQFFSPSLTVENAANSISTELRLRGIGTQSSVALESSVGVYIDGVSRSRQASAGASLVDVARVEIVKGPQGTLFGRNAVAGAVQYISNAPTNEVEGWVSLDAGNHDYVNVRGAVNLPLIDHVLAARFSGSWVEREGFLTNLVTDTKIHDMDRYSVRGQLLWTPADDVSVRMIVDKTEFDEACCSGANIFDGPADTLALFTQYGGSLSPPARVPGVSAAVPQEAGPLLLPMLDPAGTRFPNGFPTSLAADFENRTVTVNEDPFSLLDDTGISVEVNWDLNEVATFTSITAYRDYESNGESDTDYTAYDSLASNELSGTQQETFSQEFRIAGTNDQLSYVLGAYYFDQTVDDKEFLDWGVDAAFQAGGGLISAQFLSLGLIPGIPPNLPGLVDGTALIPSVAIAYCQDQVADPFEPFCVNSPFEDSDFSVDITSQDQENWAIFGQVDYNVSDRLILTAGLRFTHDEKSIVARFEESTLNPGFAFFDTLNPLIPDFDSTIEDDVVTGTLKATYFVNDNLMVYASYGRGYKAGGFNITRIGLTPESEQVVGAEFFTTGTITSEVEQLASPEFQPEFVDSYEIGLKGDFMGGRVRSNLAIFVSDFEDFQASAFVGNTFLLANAGELSSNGLEWSIEAVPNEWLSLFSSVTLLDSQYDSFTGGPCDQTPYEIGGPSVCDNSGSPIEGAPDLTWTGSARAQGRVFGDWNGFAQVEAKWTDDTHYGADNDPDKTRDSYSLFNASFGLISADERYEVSIWGRNLTDEVYWLGVFNAVGREGSLSSRHSDPRTYGVTLRTNF